MYLVFYVYSSKYPTSYPVFVLYFVLMLAICGCMYYMAVSFRSASESRGLQLLEVYYPLMILPWFFSIPKPAWRYLGLAAITFMVLVSVKRTSLIVLSTSAIAYFAVHNVVDRSKRWLSAILFSIFIFALGSAAFLYLDESGGGYFASRLKAATSDEGTGRLSIYKDTVNLILKSTPIEYVVGHGFDTVVRHTREGVSAHNDWLEVIFDFGIVGLILYTLLHVFLIAKSFELIRMRSPFAAAFAASYPMFLFMSLTSHLIIYPTYFIFLVTLWGTIEGTTRAQSGFRMQAPQPLIVRETASVLKRDDNLHG
jgi:O-antigen ligase